MPFDLEGDQPPLSLQGLLLLLKRRWLPATVVGFLVFCGLVMTAAKPKYAAEGKLLLSKTDPVSSLTDVTDRVREVSGLGTSTNPLSTEVEILKSDPLIDKTIDRLNLQNSHGDKIDVDQFRLRLGVRVISGTDLLLLSYTGESAEQAVQVVDTLMQFYLENNIRVNRSEAIAAKEFIRKQLPEVELRVTQAESALRQFKETNRVVSLQEESSRSVRDLSELSNQIRQARAELAEVASRSLGLQRQIGLPSSRAIALSTLSQSNAVQQVLSEYRKVQDQLAQERTRYHDQHPAIASLIRRETALRNQLELRVRQALGSSQAIDEQDLQISALKQQVIEDIVKAESVKLGLADRIEVLTASMATVQNRSGQLPQLEQTQRELERRLQAAQDTYEQLLKRFQEVELAENQTVGNVRVVSSARVPRLSRRRFIFPLALATVLGSITGLLTALLLDLVDKSVKTKEEAESLTGYPVLGVIPLLGAKGRSREPVSLLPARDNPAAFVGISFEMLQTTLGFTQTDHPLQVMLVTSAIAGEGKSFIAANLAIANAQMGRRVLLIDADLRNPDQHRIWEQVNLKGLSDVLVDQSNFSDTVKSIRPNFDLLTAGTIPPNPVALLASQKLAALLELVGQTYDFVIVDAPPLTLAPDALTLSQRVDGLLFVVRPRVTDSASLNRAKRLLEQAGQCVLGMVVNGDTGAGARIHPEYAYLNASQPVPSRS